jgi:DNA invertase Pin-like site-specific DNA recombinase
MVKAHAYLAVSSKGLIEGDGFPRQLKAIREYGAAHNVQIVRVFRDEGVSETTDPADRPGWSELMTVLHSNGVRAIIVERLDRLARDLMIQETIISDLQKHGFDLISVAEPDLMATDPTRILVRQVMGTVAQYEKSQIVLRLRGARLRKRAREGRCEGRKPYGFYDGEPEVIERLKALRAEGMGFDRIAAQLNSEGLKPRTAKRWHGVVINRILTGARG